ncbi:MAG: EAL domain-containing protein [Ruthenibacterium sp.]
MHILKTMLIVDDNAVNRSILGNILKEKYAVLEAENGKQALDILEAHRDEIAAMMLDLIMPVMDGYAVLEALRGDARYVNLPIVVVTDSSNSNSEQKALALGAWDFVSKPYHPAIILFRLQNAIERSSLTALNELKYLADYDALTGIYNKSKFFEATRELLDANREETFAFLRFDVDRFQLINSFFGTAEGDRLLIYIASKMAEDSHKCENSTYGRIESDIIGFCLPYRKEQIESMVQQSKKTLAKYNPNYDIVPSVGIYIIDDPTISVEEMYNRATLAAKTCKGNYVDFYAYYNEGMRAALTAEQTITNEMNAALESGQFQIYLQPQYNIHNNLPCGAEALVRWMHPQKGMLSPGVFIPVFERNGFITKLDYYVWEQACQCLHRWIVAGKKPYPLSVNVSRVNIYNPKLAQMILELVTRYEIPPALLHLELTESAYTDNPIAMKKAMKELQGNGFSIIMDDFGSGYSSLAVLKDIAIDVLKIDMQFLSESEIPHRGENIIASVIRMAKWLHIPVVAEGAETVEQVDFLRSVGCDYVQGYYFARPMPVTQYEQLCARTLPNTQGMIGEKYTDERYDDLFLFNQEVQILFNNPLQAAAVYEFTDNQVEIIRVNEAYYALLGHDDMIASAPELLNTVAKESQESLLRAFCICAETRNPASCDYLRLLADGSTMWMHLKLRYAATIGSRHVILGELSDITMRKTLDREFEKYRASWLSGSHETRTVLIVDDAAINRIILKKILQGFQFLEAENGAQAIQILRGQQQEIDLILLDISMPVMDGKAFLQYKKNLPELDGIPVIMISADDSAAQQISAFSLGANDYIIKPFIPEVVTRRVQNVLDSNQRFKDMVREYNTMSQQVKTDLMTGLINRISAERMIAQHLENSAKCAAMLMLDIDHFKKINDSCGHHYGDQVICIVADRLRALFRKEDVIARMGGDEFAVFVCNIPSASLIEQKAHHLCQEIAAIEIDGQNAKITCSVGIALSDENANTFHVLYRNADKALYYAKCHGRNTVSVYGAESVWEDRTGHEAK